MATEKRKIIFLQNKLLYRLLNPKWSSLDPCIYGQFQIDSAGCPYICFCVYTHIHIHINATIIIKKEEVTNLGGRGGRKGKGQEGYR